MDIVSPTDAMGYFMHAGNFYLQFSIGIFVQTLQTLALQIFEQQCTYDNKSI